MGFTDEITKVNLASLFEIVTEEGLTRSDLERFQKVVLGKRRKEL